MRVRISDQKILQSITPAEVLAYLRSRGANKTDDIQNKADIWQYGGEEILVPLATHFADYSMRMSEILLCLEKVKERSQLMIVEDIEHSGFDIISIRNV